MQNKLTNRRQAMKNIAIGAAGALALPSLRASNPAAPEIVNRKSQIVNRLHHSVCRWCYSDMKLEELCEQVKPMGITSIELTTPAEWPVLQKYGLTCAVGTVPDLSLSEGYNQPGLHEALNKKYMDLAKKATDIGIPNIIIFSGNRKGLDDELGIDFCAKGVEPLAKFAEKLGITVVMELLNSKVNHPDYQCDHTLWGVGLVEKVGSPNFKLLYDIYHMQIMEGDVIATIRKHHDHIGHYHTGGVPGRNEIDDSQELYYPAVMRAIADTGFKGYVAQEFIPKNADKMASLRRGVEICDV
ncbi:MAG: TIM barrel protein [Bacteroidetes bacterium]|nr:TIM barrel protein [Bacteroidota bacterium]